MNEISDSRQAPFWGRLFMVGIPGPKLDAAARELVRDLRVGGIILFSRNLESPEQVWELTRDLQREAQTADGMPLLIALDQEGGPVQRLRAPFTLIPAARKLGVEATAAEVEELARRVARELRLVGVNMNLAPVLDVARGPDCPQWQRSYGQDPQHAARFACAAIKGYLAGGVIPVAKHFPGLGDSTVDSHEVLPVAQCGSAARERHLLPFREAVAMGVPAVMTAHLVVPPWDSRPATLSPVALREKLRRDLGFDGVVITDDLEMGAIATHMTVPLAARGALAAGADLLLVCRDWQAIGEAVRGWAAAGQELIPRAREAAARLQRLRTGLTWPEHDLAAVREYFREQKKAHP